MNKKAQGISINVVIIAAIALLVLVILAVLVINAGENTDQKIKACSLQGGKCTDSTSCDEGKTEITEGKCDTAQICCSIL